MAFWGDPNTGVMKDKETSTLGYFLNTRAPETVNPPAPSFPPTATKHQHYKYLAPGSYDPEEGLERGKNNMLLYVEMTGNSPFPQEDILTYSGNFVSKGMKGTVCISRDILWDSYLLRNPYLGDSSRLGPPLLREFNRQTYAWIRHFKVVASGSTTGVEWLYGFGRNAGELLQLPEFFAWKCVSPTKWEWEPKKQHFYSEDKGGWPLWTEGSATSK